MTMTDLLDQLKQWYFEIMWQASPERKQLAHDKLAAHDKAMKEGRESPYTHPEKYDFL